MKSVLVDFYNLQLQSDWVETEPRYNIEESDELVSKRFIPPDKEKWQQIIEFFEIHVIEFFEIHAPNIVRKLTAERKKQIRNFDSQLNRFVDISNSGFLPEERFQALEGMFQASLDNETLYADGYTTLEGYEARYGISWFDSIEFHGFIKEYRYIKDLIDSYIIGDWNVLKDEEFDEYFGEDPYNAFHIYPYIQELIDKGYIIVSDLKISKLKEKGNMHSNETLDMIIKRYRMRIDSSSSVFHLGSFFHLGIYFGELFPTIYEEAILVLKGDSQIQRCQRDGCNNITWKRWNREYCDTCRHIVKNEGSNKSKKAAAKRIHIQLCGLIDKWLPQKGEKAIDAACLMWELRQISNLKGTYMFLQSSRSMGRYLNRQEVQDMLKEKGIHIEVVNKSKKGGIYKLKRI